MRDDESFAWDAHINTINSILLWSVDVLKPSARLAVWLNTEGGEGWEYENGADDDDDDDDDQHDADHDDVGEVGQGKNLSPRVDVDDIVVYLQDHLLTAEGDFEDKNTRGPSR